MSFADVKITLDNGALQGAVRFAAGVTGFIGSGVSVSTLIQIGEPRLITTLKDAEDIGITEDDNPAAWKTLRDYYAEMAGKAEAYIMLVPDTMTLSEMVDITNDNGAKKLVDYSQGRIRLLGTFFAPGVSYTPTVTDGLDADLIPALVNGQVFGNTYRAGIKPLRIALHTHAFAGDAAVVPSMLDRTENNCCVVAASVSNDGASGTGLFLGRISRIPVMRKASRIKDGAVPAAAAFVGSMAVEDFSGNELLHDKGYITLRTAVGRSGYYWSSDHMATNDQDDYSTMSRCRPIDKLIVLAYTIYFNELDDEVLVTQEGKLAAGYVKYMEAIIEQAVNEGMVGAGELSAFKASIDLNQNIISNPTLAIELRPTPVGYSTNIEVLLGYFNPALNNA